MLCFPHNMTMGNDQSGERDSFRNIETYARLKMDELGLADWQFGWDRAKRRLGVCPPAGKKHYDFHPLRPRQPGDPS